MLNRLIYIIGLIVFLKLLFSGHFIGAVVLLLAGMVAGFLKIRAVLADARERELLQNDETVFMPRTQNNANDQHR